jgi:glucose-1-phosphate thymidylyltransferase
VVNFAAESHVELSIRGPKDFILTGIVGTFTLLEAVRACCFVLPADEEAAFRFLQMSRDEVYVSLSTTDSPSAESNRTAPSSTCSAGEAGSDHFYAPGSAPTGCRYSLRLAATTMISCSSQQADPLISVNALPIYNQPKISFPLHTTVMMADTREVLLISTSIEMSRCEQLLENGSLWGIHLEYAVQPKPATKSQAFYIAENFIAGAPGPIAMGKSTFYGHHFHKMLIKRNGQTNGGTAFAYRAQPSEWSGAAPFDANGRVISIERKPKRHQAANDAVIGQQSNNERLVAIAKSEKPSERRERKIYNPHRPFLEADALKLQATGFEHAVLDTGSHDSLLHASQIISTLKPSQRFELAHNEEVVWSRGWMSDALLAELAAPLSNKSQAQYLLQLS